MDCGPIKHIVIYGRFTVYQPLFSALCLNQLLNSSQRSLVCRSYCHGYSTLERNETLLLFMWWCQVAQMPHTLRQVTPPSQPVVYQLPLLSLWGWTEVDPVDVYDWMASPNMKEARIKKNIHISGFCIVVQTFSEAETPKQVDFTYGEYDKLFSGNGDF